MPSAMTALATTTLASASATVTFSSIPGTYRDLRLVIVPVASTGTGDVKINFNGDTGASSYAQVYMYGNGSSAVSGSATNFATIYASAGATFTTAFETVITTDIFDYAQTDKHKTVLCRGNVASINTNASAARWVSTSAITSIVVGAQTNNFGVGTVISLYGVSA